jgi:hypothetical protein
MENCMIEEPEPYWNGTRDEADLIDHPAHYTAGRKIEPIDVIEDWELGYHLGNALKYISRAGRKEGSSFVVDISKAIWYLERKRAALTTVTHVAA